MRFPGLSIPVALLAAVLVAALVTALHFLRTRPRRLRVISTLLWRETRASAQARTLWHRFHQWPSFLLILLTSGLLVASLARPVIQPGRPVQELVIVLDAGSSMTARTDQETRFVEARRAALDAAAGILDSDRMAVIVADPAPRILHYPEEPAGSLRQQLETIEPARQPALWRPALRMGQILLQGREAGELVWITDPTTDTAPPPAQVRRVTVGRSAANAAVVHAQFVPDAGDPSVGTVRARVGWWGERNISIPLRMVSAQGRELLSRTVVFSPGQVQEAVSAEISADGSAVETVLDVDDAMVGDNRLRIELPRRPAIIVGLDGEVPASLRELLAAVPARMAAPGDAAVNLAVSAAAARPSAARCVRVIAEGAPLTGPAPVRLEGTDRVSGVCGDGVSLAVSTGGESRVLARAGESPVVILNVSREKGELLLSNSLFAPNSTVMHDARFVVLLAGAIRELAGWTDGSAVLTARTAAQRPETVSEESVVQTPDRQTSNTLAAASGEAVRPARPVRMGLQQVILGAALLGLILDQLLYSRGRVV